MSTTLVAVGLVRIKQAAQLLGISEWLLRRLAHDGEIPFVQRTPRSPMLFAPADLEAWAERNKH